MSVVCVHATTGESVDEMQLLEEQADKIAQEAKQDRERSSKGMAFVK